MDKRLLHILRCPISHKALSLARRDTLDKVNAAVDAGKLVNREGETIGEALSEAVVTDDGKHLYPVENGIPVMFESHSIDLGQLE